MITRELIDKCLDFAEGCKGKFAILMVKKTNFPNTLIEGTEKQQIIKGYKEQGLTTRQIADIMGCKHPNIVEHMRQYKKSVAFYGEWCEFWEFAAEVRRTPVAIAFQDILSENDIKLYNKKKIETVGDFLNLSVTTSVQEVSKTLNGLDAENKNRLFNCIREMCYDLLTVSAK